MLEAALGAGACVGGAGDGDRAGEAGNGAAGAAGAARLGLELEGLEALERDLGWGRRWAGGGDRGWGWRWTAQAGGAGDGGAEDVGGWAVAAWQREAKLQHLR
eukprot:SAG11_NODE_319_length_10822_cov_12.319500_7_plen_103_part_00